MEVPQKTNNRIAIWPSNSTPRDIPYTKECESVYNKSNCTPIFIAALFTIAKMPYYCEDWIKKMWYLYTT
jgi:hypothetical protein